MRTIERVNLSHRIIRAIKNHISEMGLTPGDRLPTEREMAEGFGVSRSSVREAVKILEAMGILESRPKHGITVRAFDTDAFFQFLSFHPTVGRKTVLDMVELRRAMDLGCVEIVSECIDEDHLAVLGQHVEAMRRTLEQPVDFLTHDWAFHFAIYDVVGNPSMQALGRGLLEITIGAFREGWDSSRVMDVALFKSHERIFLALEARDPVAMRRAVEDHFDTTIRHY